MSIQISRPIGQDRLYFTRSQPRFGIFPDRFGAIPYSKADGEVVFLMITSRSAGLWIYPKGNLMDGLTRAESAAEEAYEEAGVRGSIGTTPIGHYRTLKAGPKDQVPTLIEMFPLEVTRQFDDWPERAERKRKWVTLDESRRLLSEPGLVTMAEEIADKLPA